MLNHTTADPSQGRNPQIDFASQDTGLQRLGLTEEQFLHWRKQCRGEGGLARVVSAQRGRWVVAGHLPGGGSELPDRGLGAELSQAALSGRLLAGGTLPVTGDWVALRPGGQGLEVIDAILPRASCLSREAAGGLGEEQVLAANVDLVLCVMALGQNYNLNRLERCLSLAWESGARPVVVITKVDTESVDEGVHAEIEAVAQGVPAVFCSSLTGEGLEALADLLAPGRTAVLIGSSGAGKSTLLNALSGQVRMEAGEISEAVGKGRHTTVGRELFALPSGALVIDTPGMRELALIAGEASVDATFSELESFSGRCRFSDCSHSGEPGCAVQAAVEEGSLDGRRLKHWHKQRREIERQQALARAAERRGRARSRKREDEWRTLDLD